MYQNELIDAYKKAKNYIQDKQIAMDMGIPPQRIADFRKGRRYLTDSQAIFLAEHAKIDAEIALLGLHADRNDNPQIKALWEGIAKKYNGLGLQRLSMACGAITIATLGSMEQLHQYALYILC